MNEQNLPVQVVVFHRDIALRESVLSKAQMTCVFGLPYVDRPNGAEAAIILLDSFEAWPQFFEQNKTTWWVVLNGLSMTETCRNMRRQVETQGCWWQISDVPEGLPFVVRKARRLQAGIILPDQAQPKKIQTVVHHSPDEKKAESTPLKAEQPKRSFSRTAGGGNAPTGRRWKR